MCLQRFLFVITFSCYLGCLVISFDISFKINFCIRFSRYDAFLHIQAAYKTCLNDSSVLPRLRTRELRSLVLKSIQMHFSSFADFCEQAPKSALSKIRLNGDGEIRTLDPLLARQVLSQLSYAPVNLATTCSPIPSPVQYHRPLKS